MRVTTDAETAIRPSPRRRFNMTTCANLLGLFGLALIRFGGRGGAGLVFLFLGLLIIGLLVWALTRNESAKN